MVKKKLFVEGESMQKRISRNKAIKNAIASVKMEGFKIDDTLENRCKLIMQGKRSLKDSITQIIQKDI